MDSLKKAEINHPDVVVIGGSDCDDLAVLPMTDGRLVSWWQPNEEEKAAIAAGQPIHLHVFTGGRAPPPVALTVQGVEYPPMKSR